MESDPAAVTLQWAVHDLLALASGNGPTNSPASSPRKRGFLVPDAFQNRGHARFAIKVMIAVLASYATYTLLDWQGIRTAVTTCFFVSLTTFGESIHKFTLRASGAVIGGLIAGACIVFVLPLLTDIGQLCLLIAAVSAFAAWISTGSEAVSYAGMQIAFAFFLGVLQGYGPATDLTGLRDRVVGILIGNLWVTVVFASIWPVSAKQQAASLRMAALKKLAQLLRQASEPSPEEKMALAEDLAHADLLQARGQFEWRSLHDPSSDVIEMSQVERIASRAFAVLRIRASSLPNQKSNPCNDALAEQIDALCNHHDEAHEQVASDATLPPLLKRAQQQLEKEIAHAMRPSQI